jgi:hypothetical protein
VRIFLSGIITGSLAGKEQLHDQAYRQELKDILQAHLPEATLLGPWDMHPDAVTYGPEQAREALVHEIEAAASADLVVAYSPQASMGTAIEMWEAHRRGVPVMAITPLTHNWVVMLLARRVFATIAEFGQFVAAGGLAAYR